MIFHPTWGMNVFLQYVTFRSIDHVASHSEIFCVVFLQCLSQKDRDYLGGRGIHTSASATFSYYTDTAATNATPKLTQTQIRARVFEAAGDASSTCSAAFGSAAGSSVLGSEDAVQHVGAT